MEIVLVIHLKRQAIRILFRERPSLEYDRLRMGSVHLAAGELSECLNVQIRSMRSQI